MTGSCTRYGTVPGTIFKWHNESLKRNVALESFGMSDRFRYLFTHFYLIDRRSDEQIVA